MMVLLLAYRRGRGFEFGVPGELGGDGGVALRAGLVDGGLPALVLQPRVELQVMSKILEDIDLELVLRGAHGDKVLGRFLVEIGKLYPLIAGEMVGKPCLSALGFAANPVTHDEALVGITLHLDALVVIELAGKAAEGGGIGAYPFDAKVELGHVGELREVEARAIRGTARRAGRRYVVVDDRVGVERDVVAQEGQAPGEVEGAPASAWVVPAQFFSESGVVDVEKALQEGVQRYRFVAGGYREVRLYTTVTFAAPDDGALKAKLKVRRGRECEHLRVHPRVFRTGMAFQRANEEVVANGTEERREIRDVPGLHSVDAEGVDVFGVVAPPHAAA